MSVSSSVDGSDDRQRTDLTTDACATLLSTISHTSFAPSSPARGPSSRGGMVSGTISRAPAVAHGVFQSELRNGLPKPLLRTIRSAFLYRSRPTGFVECPARAAPFACQRRPRLTLRTPYPAPTKANRHHFCAYCGSLRRGFSLRPNRPTLARALAALWRPRKSNPWGSSRPGPRTVRKPRPDAARKPLIVNRS